MAKPDEMTGSQSYAEWQQLEADLFDNAGEALSRVRECARSRGVQPVPFLLAVLQRVLCSLPGNVWFDAGKGRGCLNLFTVLLGIPGAGKDRMMGAVAECVEVCEAERRLEPVPLHLGSGEGIVETLQPDEGEVVTRPVVFGASEVGTLHTRLTRTGSTLRGTLLDIYSGNSLGATTKGSVLVVPAKSYTAGLWVAAQPDKAHLLLDGDDDGFRHRFVWAEMLDPFALAERPAEQVGLLAVSIPSSVLAGSPITFPAEVKRLVWTEGFELAAYGVSGSNSGHRTYTRLKLAAGLALLRSEAAVHMDDWRRAGVLMDYSDKVQEYAMTYAKDRAVEAEADKLEAKEAAATEVLQRKLNKRRRLERDALEWIDAPEDGQQPASWSKFMQSKPGRDKPLLRMIGEQWEQEGVVVFSPTDTGATLAERGPNFHDALHSA
ncbi:hypothetical protein ACTXMG_05210 [Corynebacterium flavescens]|uniref:hypothetical protein n=1 Tax=Corynebacterium flavescens TaxID=28028 RepID=UPI003FD5F273